MSANYKNVEGEARVSPYYLPFNKIFNNNLLYPIENKYLSMNYTQVICEVPDAIEYDNIFQRYNTIENYWPIDPNSPFHTNFYNCNRFRSHITSQNDIYGFFVDSLEVYINGNKLDNNLIIFEHTNESVDTDIEANMFIIPKDTENGYMYISFIPSHYSYFNGDNTSNLSAHNIISRTNQEKVRVDNIIRMRKIINNIENYIIASGYGYPPTLWIGGTNNEYKSSYDNIIPEVTPVYTDHLIEIKNSIMRIENFLSLIIKEGYSITTITDIPKNGTFMVQYTESIISAITNIETILLENEI